MSTVCLSVLCGCVCDHSKISISSAKQRSRCLGCCCDVTSGNEQVKSQQQQEGSSLNNMIPQAINAYDIHESAY